MALSDLVGVQRTAPGAGKRSNRRAFLAAGQATDRCTSERGSSDSQLVTMLLPESASMTTMSSNNSRPGHGLRRRERLCRERERSNH